MTRFPDLIRGCEVAERQETMRRYIASDTAERAESIDVESLIRRMGEGGWTYELHLSNFSHRSMPHRREVLIRSAATPSAKDTCQNILKTWTTLIPTCAPSLKITVAALKAARLYEKRQEQDLPA